MIRSSILLFAALLLIVSSPLTVHAQGAEGDAAPTLVPPVLLEFVEAPYPESEAASEADVAVVLQLSIAATGEVVDVSVLESGGEAFDEAAMEAARGFVFEPATSGGEPIPVRIGYRYEFVWAPLLELKSTADFKGVVRDRATKAGIAGVTVALGSGQSTVTDEGGAFEILDLPPGLWTVELSGDGIIPVSTEEVFEVSHVVEVTYDASVPEESDGDEDEVEFEIVFTIPKVKKQVVSTEILADQGRRVPGTQGDVLKVVENLPGVARAAAGSGDLVVWGAAPQDTRVYVDGIRLPRLYHDGGYRSVIHSDLVHSVELIPGAYGPTYGRGLGGLVSVQLSRLDDEGFHGSADLNGIDGALSARTRLSDDLHFAIAARRSHLDEVVGRTSSYFTDEDVASYVPIPRFWDGQARLQYRLGAETFLEVGALASSDAIDHALPSSDPALSTSKTTSLDFYRVFARYEKRSDDGSVVSVVGSFGGDSSSRVERFGATPIELGKDSRIYGLRASWRAPVAVGLMAEIGVDAELETFSLYRSGSIGAPSREGDKTVFGRPPPNQIGSDRWDTLIGSAAPYAQLDIGLFDGRLHLIPGLRLEPFLAQTSRITPDNGTNPAISIVRQDLVVEPRLAARYEITPALGVKAAYGIYHQPPQSEDLSAVFGTPPLGVSKAQHLLLGGSYKLTDRLELEATGFLSTSEGLAVRSLSQSPALANALVQEGTGRSYGGQLLLRQDRLGPFFGWMSYSLVRSERKDQPDSAWRLFDYDQLHVFTAVASFDAGAGVEIGGRFRYSTGFPRTPVIGSYYDAVNDRYQPIFGEYGAERIPSFISADLRVSKRFDIDSTELEVYLDVQNVSNHRNPEEIVYDPSFTQQDYISGFPILPMLGARWSW